MDMLVVVQILTVLCLVGIGGYVWWQSESDTTIDGLIFFLTMFCAWLIFGMLANIESPYEVLANRIVFVCALGLIWSATVLTTRLAKSTLWVLHLSGMITVAVSGFILFTPLVVKGIAPEMIDGRFAGYSIERGEGYIFYIIIVVILASLSLGQLLRAAVRTKGKVHRQLMVVLWGLLISLLVGLFVAFFIPVVLENSRAAHYSFVAGIVAAISFIYAIVRHRLFDVRLAAVRTIAYLLSLLTLACIYFSLAYLVSATVFSGQSTTGLSVSPINILLALVLALLFQPIRHFFDHITNKIFYIERYDSNEFNIRMGHVLSSTTDTVELLSRALTEIKDTLRASSGAFMLFEQGDRSPETIVSIPRQLNFLPKEIDELREVLSGRAPGAVAVKTMLVGSSDVTTKKVVSRLISRHHAALLLPLVRDTTIVGCLILGEQELTGYGKRDLRVLGALADELMIAIQNSRSTQELRDLNASLQQRIDDATSELRQSNAKLQKLDEAKDEFISMASHQLRTPLTSVKGYIDMVLEGDAGKVTPMQKQLLAQAFDSSERMVHIINDFLNVSRLQTGKFMIETQPIELKTVVREEVHNLKSTAKSHALKLHYHSSTSIPLMNIDEGKIRQVIMNFIDNAIYYSRPGTTIDITLYSLEGQAILEVHDTGIGVPKKEQKDLFGKFFRATNARKHRPDGTGVGLYLAKKVVAAHGGEVIFRAPREGGSVFGFRLPIAKLRVDAK